MCKLQTKSLCSFQRMRIMEKRILEVKHTKYILSGGKEVLWKLSSHNYLCKHDQLYPKSRNDDSLQHNKSNKRIEDTIWITKGKLDQLDN